MAKVWKEDMFTHKRAMEVAYFQGKHNLDTFDEAYRLMTGDVKPKKPSENDNDSNN